MDLSVKRVRLRALYRTLNDERSAPLCRSGEVGTATQVIT